jgi:hypothetical protein
MITSLLLVIITQFEGSNLLAGNRSASLLETQGGDGARSAKFDAATEQEVHCHKKRPMLPS